MWFSRRLLRRVLSCWDQQRLVIRTKFAESSRKTGWLYLLHVRFIVFVSFVFTCGSCFFVEMFRQLSLQSRLETALEQEMAAQRYLNFNMQARRKT
jgi:hypothetical protein